jgi:adenylate cyclase
MSGDSEQTYFADGVVEDLITTLSKFHWFHVIAHNSSFAIRGQANDVAEIGQKRGARYILEGSVRKAGSRVRITAQLIDTTTNTHVWAERYDRVLEDIFDLQDEIVQSIIGTVVPRFVALHRSRAPYHCERQFHPGIWQCADGTWFPDHTAIWNISWKREIYLNVP